MQLNADMMFNLFIFREESNDCFARPLCGEYFVPHSYMTTKQNRAFSVAGPSIWNGGALFHAMGCDLSSSFYSLLKTFLFARSWAGSASEELP